MEGVSKKKAIVPNKVHKFGCKVHKFGSKCTNNRYQIPNNLVYQKEGSEGSERREGREGRKGREGVP